jgi:hypothetical protein
VPQLARPAEQIEHLSGCTEVPDELSSVDQHP